MPTGALRSGRRPAPGTAIALQREAVGVVAPDAAQNLARSLLAHPQGENLMNLNTILKAGLASLSLAVAAGCSTTASVTHPGTDDGANHAGNHNHASIDSGYHEVLDRLYATTPGSRELVAKARGVLVFPSVVQAGLVIGGAYGEGELRIGGAVDSYYNTTTGSIGWQIGAQSRALVFLFMTQDSLDRFRNGQGWAGGVDASVAVLKAGANGAIDGNAAQAPTVAFVMTNAGLMANLSLEGTKVTRIN
jgi:lipid-binding SYLF domain-containing protein